MGPSGVTATGPGDALDVAAVRAHFDFPGYVTGFDPMAIGDRERLRSELGYKPNEQVCVVTVGGSGVGGALVARVVEAFPEARRRVPERANRASRPYDAGSAPTR